MQAYHDMQEGRQLKYETVRRKEKPNHGDQECAKLSPTSTIRCDASRQLKTNQSFFTKRHLSFKRLILFCSCRSRTQLADKNLNFESSRLGVQLFIFRLSDINYRFQVIVSTVSVCFLMANSCLETQSFHQFTKEWCASLINSR